jgi:hypothetical protein
MSLGTPGARVPINDARAGQRGTTSCSVCCGAACGPILKARSHAR